MMKGINNILVLILLVILLASCNETYTPKPRGYFRIDLPDHEYVKFDTNFPYSFEYPVYAGLTPDPFAPEEPYWLNVEFPDFDGRIHLSYKKVDGNLVEYLEEAPEQIERELIDKLLPKVQEYFSTYENKTKEELEEIIKLLKS